MSETSNPETYISNPATAEEMAYAEKPARDFAREADILPAEKGMLDSIAERNGEGEFKEMEALRDIDVQASQRIESQQDLIRNTEDGLAKVRQELGLPQPDHDDPSVEELKAKLLQSLERKRSIGEQRENIQKAIMEQLKREGLQKLLEKVFKILETFSDDDVASIEATGQENGKDLTLDDGKVDLDPKTAKLLAHAFKLGLRKLPEVLNEMPKFMEQIDSKLSEKIEDEAHEALAQGSEIGNLVADVQQAEQAAYAGKSARDFARQPGVTSDEKASIDAIALRREDAVLGTVASQAQE